MLSVVSGEHAAGVHLLMEFHDCSTATEEKLAGVCEQVHLSNILNFWIFGLSLTEKVERVASLSLVS